MAELLLPLGEMSRGAEEPSACSASWGTITGLVSLASAAAAGCSMAASICSSCRERPGRVRTTFIIPMSVDKKVGGGLDSYSTLLIETGILYAFIFATVEQCTNYCLLALNSPSLAGLGGKTVLSSGNAQEIPTPVQLQQAVSGLLSGQLLPPLGGGCCSHIHKEGREKEKNEQLATSTSCPLGAFIFQATFQSLLHHTGML